MTVRDLQERIGKLDPELRVLCYTEDASLLAENLGFRLLEIAVVDTTQGEMIRTDAGTPYLKLGAGPSSVTVAILEVTSEF